MKGRNFLFALSKSLGVPSVFRYVESKKGRVPILVFHSIHPVFDPLVQSLHPSQFEHIIREISRHYTFTRLDSLLVDATTCDSNACIVTFDDALKGFIEFAWPILAAYNVPVTLFVPTDSVNTGKVLWNYEVFRAILMASRRSVIYLKGETFDFSKADVFFESLRVMEFLARHPYELRILMNEIERQLEPKGNMEYIEPMNWSDIRQLHNSGVAIESHSHHHLFLPSLQDSDICSDFEKSIELITANTGTRPRFIAAPMGGISKGVADAARSYFNNILSTSGELYSHSHEATTVPRILMSDRAVPETLHRISGFHQLFV